MPYYDTIEEDLARAKQILKDGKTTVPDNVFDEEIAALVFNNGGGAIYGKDNYAAYKLLESFVVEIERLRKLVEIMTAIPDCICRTQSCGHRASEHCGPNGACILCKQECWS